jgi:lysozyme family protein
MGDKTLADFLTQYRKTCANEGLLSNDSGDSGGLTWKGITVTSEKDWKGWPTVFRTITECGYTVEQTKDNKKALDKVSSVLVADTGLEAQVQAVYKARYWDVMRLDLCPSQLIAGELFDNAVNQGCGSAVKILQRSLNVLNKQGSLFPDLTVDGGYGNGTHTSFMTFFKAVPTDRWPALYKALVCLRGTRYIEICEKNSSQEKFIYGWLSRLMGGN